jgi:galactokinase/mevalonate kinase-like predicted kinase
MAPVFNRLAGRAEPQWFATFDPDRPLGSGGGTANALLAAWRAEGANDFRAWLRTGRRTIIHAGGQSRRLPAYAAVGKALMPIPALRGTSGHRPDQALIDLQATFCDALFERAPETSRVLIASGDALLRLDRLPDDLPDADVVCIGLRADAEAAQHHGTFFLSHERPHELAMFLQKPSPDRIRELALTHDFLLDAGIWLLSERAVKVLLNRCGIAEPSQDEEIREYELYSDFGLALGRFPVLRDTEVNALSCAVVAVRGEFLHFGTSRQLIESVTRLHDQAHHAAPLGFLSTTKRHPDQHVQNAAFDGPPPFLPNQPYWVENAHLPPTWTLRGENVVTGVPPNDWKLTLPQGVCLDMVPVEGGICARVYGIDDAFKGSMGEASTLFLGRPVRWWLEDRGLEWDEPETDIQRAALFPVLTGDKGDEDLVAWMIDGKADPAMSARWREATRLSAADLLRLADMDRLYAQRQSFAIESLKAMRRNHGRSMFHSLDLERAAEMLHRHDPTYVPEPLEEGASLVKRMHDAMFRSALLRLKGDERWEAVEAEAFGSLREAILANVPLTVPPKCGVAPDQIVWGRSPLRFDLAGGWTDTPPYCLLHGGRVLNVAIELNGQPPVQVFIRRSERRDILLRSIDLGTERRFTTFGELAGNLTEKSEFSLAQAALTLAGFSPESGAGGLEEVLEGFGGGIEMSLLAAVPKGSGLGTSSILASTILATLNEFCRLGWGQADVMARTMALEQILSTGGGWQDQAGGCFAGIKDLETPAGLAQNPTCRWLPERLLGPENANHVALLYYTGITRVAKSVLREIVRGMFLNSGPRLDTLRKIRENVQPAVDSIQRNDIDALGTAIRRSWELNQELDSGTNPPAVRAILARVEPYLCGAKLLGAGGGGFIFMIAKDLEAAGRIRAILESDPPSERARFFDFRVSSTGLEVTKS